MSKHNNNLGKSLAARCKCGRYITIGEEKMGMHLFNYECPDCKHRRFTEYYEKRKK